MILLSIYDKKANIFNELITTTNVELVKRDLARNISLSKDSVYYLYSSDFELYMLGNFDNESGRITVPDNNIPVLICSFEELKNA